MKHVIFRLCVFCYNLRSICYLINGNFGGVTDDWVGHVKITKWAQRISIDA